MPRDCCCFDLSSQVSRVASACVTSNQPDYIFRSEAEALSRELNMRLYRTSVKDDLNVSVVFQHLAENYVNKVGKQGVDTLIEYSHCFVIPSTPDVMIMLVSLSTFLPALMHFLPLGTIVEFVGWRF